MKVKSVALEFEGVKFDGRNQIELEHFCDPKWLQRVAIDEDGARYELQYPRYKGEMLRIGDWLLKYSNGYIFVVESELFHILFDEAKG